MTQLGTFAPIKKLSVHTETLFPTAIVELHDIFGYSNATSEALARARNLLSRSSVTLGPVRLVKLPPKAVVLGQSWRLLIGTCFAAEQLHYRRPNQPPPETLVLPPDRPRESIDDEAVLIARFGDGTWGHWIGELLPKIAVCERVFPKRFRYAVPAWALRSDILGPRMLESIIYYGVDPSRLLHLRGECDYQFSSLFAVTPVWRKRVMHPDVLTVLRPDEGEEKKAVSGRVALLRSDNRRREISNSAETLAILKERGYACVDIAFIPFSDQVDLFRTANTIFSVLGSSLTGLVYASPGISVVSVSPDGFRDGFFSGFLQQLPSARYCNVIGPIVEEGKFLRDSSFSVPARELVRALDVAEAFEKSWEAAESSTSP